MLLLWRNIENSERKMINIKTDPSIPEEFRGNDPQWWIDQCLNDLFFLCKFILHHGKTKEYRDLNLIHLKLCDFLTKNPNHQKLVLMFRDGLKSSIGRGFLIQWILRKLCKELTGKAFIYSGIVDLAEDHINRIWKELISNQLLQAFFYDYLPHKKSDFDVCSNEGIRFKGIEIDIGSPEKTLTGHHYELGINDNLVNEINSQSETSRKKTIGRWQEQESILSENAEEIIFETTWWPDDLAGHILDPEDQSFDYSRLYRKPYLEFLADSGYSVFSCPARDERGNPVFPEKVDNKYLERKKRKQGSYLYNALYELQPTMEKDVVFKRSWIIHYKKLPNPFIRNLVIDCAGTTEKESSYTAMSLGDWDCEGNLHLVYARKKKLDPMEVKAWALRLIEASKEEGRPVYCVGIEKEKYGIFLADLLKAEDIEPYIILIDMHSMKRKVRLDELVSKYQMGRILSRHGLKDYEKDLKTYYRGKVKDTDILDTIYYHFRIQQLPRKVKIPDFVPIEADDFAEQIKRIRARQGQDLREIASNF